MVVGNSDYFELGVKLFNQEEFFLAHECFEIIWANTEEDDYGKLCYQGLIQTSVGCYHLKNNDRKNSLAQFTKASIKLQKYLPLFNNLDIFTIYLNVTNLVDCLNDSSIDITKCSLPKLNLIK